MKVLATNYFPHGDLAAGLYRLGADRKTTQFRMVLRCNGVKDANRRCRIFGFERDIFSRVYTTETGNEKEIAITQDGDLWFEINPGKYASRKQALAAMGVEVKKHDVQIINNRAIADRCEKKFPRLWKEVTERERYSLASWYSLSEEAFDEWERWMAQEFRRKEDV